MAKIAKFYERLPKGPMPEIKPRSPLARYKYKYFGKEPSPARKSSVLMADRSNFQWHVTDQLIQLALWHAIISIMLMGYGFEYYFHLSTLTRRA